MVVVVVMSLVFMVSMVSMVSMVFFYVHCSVSSTMMSIIITLLIMSSVYQSNSLG